MLLPRYLAVVAVIGASSCSATDAKPSACDGVQCGERAYCDEATLACFCEPGARGDPDEGCQAHGDMCADAEARLGHVVCAHAIPDEVTWTRMSVGGAWRADARRTGKYLVPAIRDARLPTVFADANTYPLHYCLMARGFEPLFPGFTPSDYARVVLSSSAREYYGGSVFELAVPLESGVRFTFIIETLGHENELLSTEQIHEVYRQLADRFGAGVLAYMPYGEAQTVQAEAWSDVPFPVVVQGETSLSFEPYTPGTAFGRIRLKPDNGDALEFGWQDILVLEHVPLLLEGVMAGAVTGERQDALSHLNVLSGMRGTPNMFVADPLEAFAIWADELVRLEVGDAAYSLRTATLAEAEAFWLEHRPKANVRADPDDSYVSLDDVLTIASDSEDARLSAVARFGAKVTGLATLYAGLDDRYQARAFGIPVAHYLAFMDENVWSAPVGASTRELSYAATIDAWMQDQRFRSDAATRRDWLAKLRSHMETHATVPGDLITDVGNHIADVFGDRAAMVRLRSSSNAEDSLVFNGAGLYESVSVCALDDDVDAPTSVCDSTANPKPIAQALRQVWASLWNHGAFEEREYYQIDHRRIAMGALVSTRFDHEDANGVAFTGNPASLRDDRFVVNVQLGDVDVVGSRPGVVAELDRLRLEHGVVTEIERAAASSLAEPGQVVMTDVQLRELGAVMADIESWYPIDAVDVEAGKVLLDLEFKLVDGELFIKQIRPFVRKAATPGLGTCFGE